MNSVRPCTECSRHVASRACTARHLAVACRLEKPSLPPALSIHSLPLPFPFPSPARSPAGTMPLAMAGRSRASASPLLLPSVAPPTQSSPLSASTPHPPPGLSLLRAPAPSSTVVVVAAAPTRCAHVAKPLRATSGRAEATHGSVRAPWCSPAPQPPTTYLLRPQQQAPAILCSVFPTRDLEQQFD